MAVPIATAASQSLGPGSGNSPTRELIKCLIKPELLYEAIAEHPQAGVFHRFTEEWTFCLAYLESEVSRRSRDAKDFCATESGNAGSLESESSLRDRLAQRMMALFEGLKMHGTYLSCNSCPAVVTFR